MNVLQPEIVKIGTRRYRKNVTTFNSTTTTRSDNLRPYEEETSDMYQENRYNEDDDEPSCSGAGLTSCKIKDDAKGGQGIDYNADGTYKCVLTVAQSYFGFILGKSGEKKAALERDTQTRIKTPGRGKLGDWIAIEGKSKSSVDSCRNRILIIVSVARHQKPFTHMLTFPVNFQGLKDKLQEFKSAVLKTCLDDRGVDDSIFQFGNKLHLTICTITLLSEYEVNEAVDLLEECRRTFIKEALNGRPAMVIFFFSHLIN